MLMLSSVKLPQLLCAWVRMTPGTPTNSGYLPVRNDARVGEQTGQLA